MSNYYILNKKAMKRLVIFGLMLASAFALTNCTEQIQLQEPDNDIVVDESTIEAENPVEEVSIPFEVYANPSAETKTVNAGNLTNWEVNDKICVYHAAKGNTTTFHKHSEFTIRDVNEGLFGGALRQELSASNDWYFLYPYSSSEDTPISAQVTIGAFKNEDGSYNYVQGQTGADSKAHIQGEACPMYGATKFDANYQNGVPKEQNPRVRMRHLSALVAIKIVNESGNPISIEHLELESTTNHIVGNMTFDLTGSTPYIKSSNGSRTASLQLFRVENERGIEIAKDSEAKFYMAVAPVKDKFTIRVNGTPISKDLEIPLTSGNITTLKVTIPALRGTQTFNTKKGNVEFVTWNQKSEDGATINGQTGLNVYTVKDGSITIKGTLEQFLGKTSSESALPLSFYAGSQVKEENGQLITYPAKLDVELVQIYKNIDVVVFKKEIDMSFSGKDLSSNMNNMRVGFDLPIVGLFKDNISNLIVLDETKNYYYIDEAKANKLIKAAGVDVEIQTFRDAIFNSSQDAWKQLYKLVQLLAPGQFAENRADGQDTALVQLLDLMIKDGIAGGIARPMVGGVIKTADITIVLKTTGEAVCWGLNVQSKDTDISKSN